MMLSSVVHGLVLSICYVRSLIAEPDRVSVTLTVGAREIEKVIIVAEPAVPMVPYQDPSLATAVNSAVTSVIHEFRMTINEAVQRSYDLEKYLISRESKAGSLDKISVWMATKMTDMLMMTDLIEVKIATVHSWNKDNPGMGQIKLIAQRGHLFQANVRFHIQRSTQGITWNPTTSELLNWENGRNPWEATQYRPTQKFLGMIRQLTVGPMIIGYSGHELIHQIKDRLHENMDQIDDIVDLIYVKMPETETKEIPTHFDFGVVIEKVHP